ncbi:hypothetical protein AB0383_20700 [Amycolatopsis sp. NPDC051373]|uniref:hypothetical protein n=1 Tax=Amycolatopsis sp. NPDC051373 TaxID=3155801 RepID=UPI0034504BD7
MKLVRAVSTEFVECAVKSFNPATSAPIDISADVVQVAFTAPGVDPVAGDWQTATWTYPGIAGILVGSGTGGLVLAKGDYDWYVRVMDNPEETVTLVDTLRII